MPATLSILTNVFTDPRERAKAIGVWAGVAGARHRARARHRRLAARALLVGLGLPRQRARRDRRPRRWRLLLVPDVAGPDARAGSTRSARSCRSSASAALLCGDHRGARPRAGLRPTVLGGFAVAVVVARRVRGVGAAHRPPDARPALLPEPALLRRAAPSRSCSSPCSGHLPADAVPAVRARLPRSRPAWPSLPIALALMIVGAAVARAVAAVRQQGRGGHRAGHRAVGLADPVDGTGRLAATASCSPSIVLMGIGMGLAMAPATESIMGSLPLGEGRRRLGGERHTREVGGALGVAILGSLLAAGYHAIDRRLGGDRPAARPGGGRRPRLPRRRGRVAAQLGGTHRAVVLADATRCLRPRHGQHRPGRRRRWRSSGRCSPWSGCPHGLPTSKGTTPRSRPSSRVMAKPYVSPVER